MKKKLINLISYILTIGLGIFLIWLSLKDLTPTDIEKIKFALKKAKYGLLIPVLILGLLSHWSRAKRWQLLIKPVGFQPTTLNTFCAVMIGYLANLAMPRLGEVLKCTLLAKYEKIPADTLIGTIIAERAFDILCLLILFIITYFVQIDFANQYLQQLYQQYIVNKGTENTGFPYLLLGGFIIMIALFFYFRKRIATFSFMQKIKSIFSNIFNGIMSFKNMQNRWAFVFHTLFIWSMYLGMIILGFQCIPETAHLGIKAGFSVLSFGSVGMIVTPGGIGAYQYIVNDIILAYGIDKPISIAMSWIIWLVPTLIIILVGFISILLLPFVNKSKGIEK